MIHDASIRRAHYVVVFASRLLDVSCMRNQVLTTAIFSCMRNQVSNVAIFHLHHLHSRFTDATQYRRLSSLSRRPIEADVKQKTYASLYASRAKRSHQFS